MVQYLTQSAAAQQPGEGRRLVNALAASQGRNAILSGLTRGEAGRVRGPDPAQLQATLEAQDRQEAYRRERDAIKDAQWALDYKADVEAARLKAAGAGGVKPGAKALEQYNTRLSTMASINNMRAQIGNFSPEARDEYDSPYYEILSGMLPDSFKRRADESFYSPEVDRVLRQGQAVESQIRRMFAGTAVTKYEGADTEKWSPMAPGLSAEQRQRRWDAIEADSERLNREFTQTYGPQYARPPQPDPYQPAAPAAGGTGKYTIISVE